MYLGLIIIIALAILVLCTMWGRRRGFLLMLIPFCSLFAALILTRYTIVPISNLIYEHTNLYYTVENAFDDKLPEFSEPQTNAQQIDEINESNLPDFVKTSLIQNNNSIIYEKLGVRTFEEYVKSFLVKKVVDLIVFVCVLLITFAALRILCVVLHIADSLPVLHGISGFLGGVIGLAIGVVAAAVVSMILCTVFANVGGYEVLGDILNNRLMELISRYNVFIDWIL